MTEEGERLAAADISNGVVRATLTFSRIDKNFSIDLNSSMEVDSSSLYKYFEDNPDATTMEQT